MLLKSFLPFLAVIMRDHRTVRERSEYSITALSHGSAKAYIANECKLIQILKNLKIFLRNKKTLSTVLGFEPRSLDCRSTAVTTELHRHSTSPSPREDLLLSHSGSVLQL